MRTLIVLLLLASGFGLAALWQSRHQSELRAEQHRSWEISDGELAETESGTIPEGWGVVVVGAPSGAAPLELARSQDAGSDSQETPAPLTEEVTQADRFDPPLLDDLELQVQPGQTLSGIAHAHYGSAATALLQALADYNGIEDADSLRSGMTILLPELERLLGEQE